MDAVCILSLTRGGDMRWSPVEFCIGYGFVSRHLNVCVLICMKMQLRKIKKQPVLNSGKKCGLLRGGQLWILVQNDNNRASFYADDHT